MTVRIISVLAVLAKLCDLRMRICSMRSFSWVVRVGSMQSARMEYHCSCVGAARTKVPWFSGGRQRSTESELACSGDRGGSAATYVQVHSRYSASEMIRRSRLSHRMHCNELRTSRNFTRVTRENNCWYCS